MGIRVSGCQDAIPVYADEDGNLDDFSLLP